MYIPLILGKEPQGEVLKVGGKEGREQNLKPNREFAFGREEPAPTLRCLEVQQGINSPKES